MYVSWKQSLLLLANRCAPARAAKYFKSYGKVQLLSLLFPGDFAYDLDSVSIRFNFFSFYHSSVYSFMFELKKRLHFLYMSYNFVEFSWQLFL